MDKKVVQTQSKIVKIGEASKLLGVSIDTLRRWEKRGWIRAIKTPGGTRFYDIGAIRKINTALRPGRKYGLAPKLRDSSQQELRSQLTTDPLRPLSEASNLNYRKEDTTKYIIPQHLGNVLENQESRIKNQGGLGPQIQNPLDDIKQFPIAKQELQLISKKVFLRSALILSLAGLIFTALITSGIIASYFIVPKQTVSFLEYSKKEGQVSSIKYQGQIQKDTPHNTQYIIHNTLTSLLSPFNDLALSTLNIMHPKEGTELAKILKRVQDDRMGAINKGSPPGVLTNVDVQTNYKNLGLPQVLAESTPSAKFLEINADTHVNGALTVNGPATVTGNLTAPNILYSVVAGDNITIAGDKQNPTISAVQQIVPDASTTIKGIASFSDSFFAVTAGAVTLKASGITTDEIKNGTVSNADLANSSITITPGTGLSGGGSVSLGGSVTLTSTLGTSITLTSEVDGVLPIANGGTNKALTLVAGGVLWTDADSFEVTAAGTTGQVLVSAGTSAPTWTTLSGSSITADSLDYTEFKDTLTYDADLTTAQTTYTETRTFTGLASTGLTFSGNSLTSGSLTTFGSTAASDFTGSLVNINLSESTGASSNTGSLLTLTNSGTANANTSVYIKHYATGTNNLAFRVDDASGDTSPFVIDGGGQVGIGDSSPSAPLEVGDGTDSLQVSSIGDITFVDADGAASITGPAGGALGIAAANSQALNLTTTTAGNISLDPAGVGDTTIVTDGASGSYLNISGLSASTGNALCVDGSTNVVTCTVGSGGISGSGTIGQVAFFDGTSSITSETSGFGWITTAGSKGLAITSDITTAASGTGLLVTASSVTTGSALSLVGPTTTGVTTGASSGFVKIASDIGSAGTEGSLVYLAPDFSAGSATTGNGIKNVATDSTAFGNTDYGYYGSLALTGNAAKTGYGIYQTVTDTSTTGTTLYAADLLVDANGVTGTGNKTLYGLRSQVTNDTPTDTNAATIYGGYFTATGNTGGTSSTGYGVYSDVSGSDINYGLYIANTGTTTDIRLQNAETIDNDVDGTINLAVDATSALKIGSTGISSIGNVAHTIVDSSGALAIDSATTGAINIGTGANAKTITIGNNTTSSALAFTSGTGSQTFTSSVVSGTTTTSAFVFNGSALTSGTGIYATSATLTTGKLAQLSTGSSDVFSSGTLLDMRTTSIGLTGAAGTGSLLNLDWSPGSATTATGDLFALNIGTNGTTTGKLFNILDTSSSIFSVSETAFETSLPSNFTSAGDVSIAYDLQFTNPTSSFIKSVAPLNIVSGEVPGSSDLILKTYNNGTIVFDSADTTGTSVDLTNVSLTTGTGINQAYNGLTTGTGEAISSTSTAGGASGSSSLLTLTRSGANTNATHTAYGLQSSVTNTGTTNTNIAGLFTATGATTNYAIQTGAVSTAGTANYGISIGAVTGATSNYEIAFAGTTPEVAVADGGTITISDGTNTLCTIADAGTTGNLTCTGNITGSGSGTAGFWTRTSTTLSPATANDIVSITSNSATALLTLAPTGVTGTGLAVSALSGTTANTGINIGAISGTGATGTGITVGNISTTGTTNYGLQLGTMTGGTTSNYQISTGILTSATTTTNAQINLGGVVTTGGTTNYGINVGALSGTGTTNTALNITALTSAGVSTGVSIGGLSGAGTTNKGIDIGAISGATSSVAGINLSTITGGTGVSTLYGINSGTLTSIASATAAFQANLGAVVGATTTGFGGIQTGAVSGTGTTSYGINLGTNSSTATTNYGITVGAISGTGTTNYGLYVDTVSGAGANYAAIFAGGNVGIGDISPAAALTVGSGDLFQVTTAGIISTTPSSNSNALTITGSSITSANLVNLDPRNTSGTIFNLAYGASATLAGSLTGFFIDLNSGNVVATNQSVTGANFKIPTVTDTHTSGTKTLTGLLVNFGSGAGINQNGVGGTLEYIAGDFQMPALTQTAGTLNAYGLKVTTPSSITTGGTAYGVYVSPTGVGAGTLNGLNIGTITGLGGTEDAIAIGTGWDSVLKVGSTTIINGSGVTQVAGGGTGAATLAANGVLYGNTTSAVGVTSAGATGQVLIGNTGAAPSWGTISGSTCSDCVLTDPSSTQTIAPTGNNTTGLSIRQTSTALGGNTPDIFNITSSDGVTKYFYVDSAGNVSTSATSGQTLTLTPLTDVTALTLVGTNVTSAKNQYINTKNSSGTIFDLSYGAAQTLAGTIIGGNYDLSTNVTATNQSVSGQVITLPAATNTSGTQNYKGLVVTGGSINENGGTATNYIGADITIPALTQTSGTLNAYGVEVTTPSSITTGGTAYGVYVNAVGVGAGTLNGVNIGTITPGSGVEYGLAIGSGWDSNIYLNDTTSRVLLADGGTIVIHDGTNTLCTFTDSGTTGDLSCTGTITGVGAVGYWTKVSTTLSPATANDIVSITSNSATAVLTLAPTGVTGTGLAVSALSGTTANTGISIGAISGVGATGTGITVGNISTTGTTNYGLQLGTMTGGTTSNYQISTGILTSATTTTNAQLNLGGVVTTGGTTNYGINVGALSGTGTTNYGVNIAALTSTGTTNYGLNVGGATGAATTNYGVFIGAVSGASTNISLAFAKENAHTIQIVDTTTANTAGGALTIKSAAGLGTTATAAGGALSLASGAGGALSATASTAGAGGAFGITGGVGGATSGAVTGSTVGGIGSTLTFTAGAGGAATGGSVANTAGAGGAISLVAGAAGAASGTGPVGAAGGAVSLTGGAGNLALAGGAVNLTGGQGGTTGTGGALVLAAGAGAAGTGTGTGGNVTITSGAGGSTRGQSGDITLQIGTAYGNEAAGTLNILGAASGAGNQNGSTINVTAGAASDQGSGTGGAVNITGGVSGGTSSPAGGLILITSGAGRDGSTVPGISSGAVTLKSGVAGTATTSTAGNSGLVSITAGAGGAASGASGIGGNSGGLTLTPGAGGNAGTGNAAGGNAGTLTIAAGVGGNGIGTGAGGAGSSFALTGGNGGTTTTGTGGTAGTISLVAGNGGVPTGAGTGVVGGNLTLTAGNGSLALAGGAVSITAGTGGATGAGGALTLDSGAGQGGGANGVINIGTAAQAKTITIGNNTGATALALTSGTGSQTFTSSVVSGTTTTSGFVFDATAITSGTGLYLTTDSVTTGKLLDVATTGNTWTGNSTTSGLVNIASTSTAGTVSDSDILVKIAREGANANTAHTAYGLYSTVTNTNVTSGTNIAGYFSASGATTNNYSLQVAGTAATATNNTRLINFDGTLSMTTATCSACIQNLGFVQGTIAPGGVSNNQFNAWKVSPYSSSTNFDSGAVVRAITAEPYMEFASAETLDTLIGVYTKGAAASVDTTISSNMGVYVDSPDSTGTIATNYGIFIADQIGGDTSDYGLAIAGADTQVLWLSSDADTTDAANGIAFGSSRDTNLYRSAANTLRTGDGLTVDLDLIVSGGDITGANSASIDLGEATTGSLTFTAGTTGDFIFTLDADTNTQFTATAPGVDAVVINGGTSVTDGVDGLQLTFGTSNVSGNVVDITPTFAGGITDTLTYNVIDIDAFTPTNAAGTDTVNGLSIGALTQGADAARLTASAINIGAGWDTSIKVADTGFVDLSSISHGTTATMGLKLPQNATLTNGPAVADEGYLAYDSGTDKVKIWDGDSWNDISGASTTLQQAYDAGNTILTDASGDVIIQVIGGGTDTQFEVNAASAPEIDMVLVSNAGQGIITTAVDGLQVEYVTAGTTASTDNAALRVNVTSNNSGATTTLEGIYIDNLSSAEANSTETALRIGTGWDSGITVESGGITISGGSLTYSGSSMPLITDILSPEYQGAVLFADGGTNAGTMTSDYTNAQATGSRATYYEWNATTATPLQDYDIVVRFTLPANFGTWETGVDQAITFRFVTESTSTANNQIDTTVRLQSLDTADATESDMVSGVAGTWTSTAIDDSELTDCNAAGETCVIELKMQSMNDNYARIGDIELKYRATF